jgi:AcrR family transcriptional regulator
MPRRRIIPDAQVFALIQGLIDRGGDRAVSFASVATASGLAAPTLVQRYGSREAMVAAARQAYWEALEARTAEAIAATAGKGPQALLKAIGTVEAGALAADLRDPGRAPRATAWRGQVEAALAQRLHGTKAQDSAAILFALWQGQSLWAATGESAVRLKDAVKRLT